MFEDREDAGRKLSFALKKSIKSNEFVSTPILRGGIILGKVISDSLKIPLLPVVVKKIGAPFNKELAIGAVTFGKIYYFDKLLIKRTKTSSKYQKIALEEKWEEVKILQKKFGLEKISFKNKKVIVIDDGIATGNTVICAALFLKKEKAKEIILATPIISKEVFKNVAKYFNKIISLNNVEQLESVSQFYKSFPQIEDKRVIDILEKKEMIDSN